MPISPQMVVQIAPISGASEVTAQRAVTGSTSTTRTTACTPTSGKKIRAIAVFMFTTSSTAAAFEVYFGTGANIGSDATKIIAEQYLDVGANEANTAVVFPDGAGPVGAVDDVVSIRTSTDIGANGIVNIIYREE